MTLIYARAQGLTHAHKTLVISCVRRPSYAHTSALLRTLSIPLTHTCALERFSYAHSYAQIGPIGPLTHVRRAYAHAYARVCKLLRTHVYAPTHTCQLSYARVRKLLRTKCVRKAYACALGLRTCIDQSHKVGHICETSAPP